MTRKKTKVIALEISCKQNNKEPIKCIFRLFAGKRDAYENKLNTVHYTHIQDIQYKIARANKVKKNPLNNPLKSFSYLSDWQGVKRIYHETHHQYGTHWRTHLVKTVKQVYVKTKYA